MPTDKTPDELRARAEQALHQIVRSCCPPIYGNFDYAKAVPMLLEFLGEASAESEQAIRQATMAEARIDNSSWRVFIGSICIAQWIGSNAVVSGNHMVKPEIAAKWLAAKINAEIAGGIAAYGCAQEAKIGEKCVSWCGSDDCPHTIRAAPVSKQSIRQAAMADVKRLIRKRQEERFAEHGTTESDTNAQYYGGRNGDELAARDEEGDDIIEAIERAASLPVGVAVVPVETVIAAARKLRLIGAIYDGDKESRRLADELDKVIGSAK